MSKTFGGAALLLAIALSFTGISCTGPVFIHPPAAAASGTAAPASALAAATPAPVATISPWHGSEIFIIGFIGILLTLGLTMYAFRDRAQAT